VNQGKSNRNWFVALCAIAGMLIPSLWMWLVIHEPDEGVRIRSSLSLDMGAEGDFDWKPASQPASFLGNQSAATAYFSQVWSSVSPPQSPLPEDNLARGISIAQHLMSGVKRSESPIRSDLETTHRAIVIGRGYCADFAKVFNAVALAGAVPVRQWGFSFNAFGSGHTFNEIFDLRLNKWVLIDSFHSLYFADTRSGEPLSTIELHDRLLESPQADGGVRVVHINPDRFPFKSDSAALNYYRRGMPQLYLVWGNNVFDYERTTEFRVLGRLSRSAEELASILRGHYARMRVYPNGVSDRDVDALAAHRNTLIAVTISWLLSMVLFLPLLWRSLPSVLRELRRSPQRKM
jgi:hypothetical protein